MADKVIYHCDCNNYYASVELLKRPELANKPVAVSGSVDDRHGIILAKNQMAKLFGVKTAETIWQARRKCPALTLLPPHSEEYQKYSKIINEIYAEYSDRVEPFGIDESWLDMTGSWQLFGPTPGDVANGLRARIIRDTGLTVSIGVSFNKVFAKLASDYKKPNATTVIGRNDVESVIWPMDVSALLYVGKKAKSLLGELGIQTIGQLAQADEGLLVQLLGKQGAMLKRYATGQENSPVAKIGETEPIKSVGNGRTFKRDLLGAQDIRVAVGSLADEVGMRLREHNLYTSTVQVMIKDINFKSITRQKQLDSPTNLAKNIVNAVMELICDNWQMTKPIRMLTITAMALGDLAATTQLSLFKTDKEADRKREKLEKSSIVEASALHNDIGVKGEATAIEEDV